MSSTLSGLDSLLSIVQMPSGIPVPTMSIGKAGSKNASLFAIRMLSLSDKKIAVKLDQYIKNMANSVPTIPKDLK
jgi:5-(carboxyamino)imidazole ribonucleotide mutase